MIRWDSIKAQLDGLALVARMEADAARAQAAQKRMEELNHAQHDVQGVAPGCDEAPGA